jgi:hypothetical protein
MLHRKIFKTVLPLLAAGCFIPAISNAQLTVLPNGNVGIGNPAPVQKLDVVLNAADPAQEAGRFANNSTTASPKYGIRNTVSNAGTSTRYGIYNDVQTLSTSGSAPFGIYNSVNPGTGASYGLYNITNAGGTGFKYGQLNYTFQNSASTTLTLGIYNYTTTTAGYIYGLYNYNYIGGTSANTQYGHYNYQYSSGTGTHYGIYNYVYTATATTAGTRYGVWTEVPNIGTGIRYGVYSRALGTPNYAGYFDGNVFINGNFTVISDDGLKTNLEPITGALDILGGLNPKKFDFRKDIKGMVFPEGRQLGIMASEVEKDLPELVKKITTPLNKDEVPVPVTPEVLENRRHNGDDSPPITQQGEDEYFTFNSVNYIGLIPVLVQAVKDLRQMVQSLQQQLQEQKAITSRLKPAVK